MQPSWVPKHIKYMQCKAGCPKSDVHKLFRFLKKDSRYKKWAEIDGIPYESGDKMKSYYLCGRHFHRNQFRTGSRSNIIYGAVPTITRKQWEKENKSGALAYVETERDQTSPPSLLLTVAIDASVSSFPVISPSVSGNEITYHSNENQKPTYALTTPSVSRVKSRASSHGAVGYIKSAPPASLDGYPSDQVLDGDKWKDVLLLECISREKT